MNKEKNRVRDFTLTQSSVLGRIPFVDEIRKEFSQFQNEIMDAILNKLK